MFDRNCVWFVLIFLVVLLLPAWPALGAMMLFLLAGTTTFYYGAITAGLIKEPLLDYFRQYGVSDPMHPLVRLLIAGGAFSFSLSFVVPTLFVSGFFANLLPSFVFTVLALMFEVGALLVFHQKTLRSALPLWYARLLQESSRQEQRHIGWAWLRLPRSMRRRMNGDQRAFRIWSDLVRLTVIYGAYDPESPWHRWT
ncbi:MAG: hypothetical protein K8S97_12705 [Anaerolineae bacterium]|nr:hypothetical protein [Anaerolineae bacterium]